jgi:CheY-like chemotaxis protein
MKDKLTLLISKLKSSYFTAAGFLLLVIQICYFTIIFPTYDFDSDESNKIRIIDLLDRIIYSTGEIKSEYKIIKERKCLSPKKCNESIRIMSKLLIEKNEEFIDMAGIEKNWINIIGLPSIRVLNLHLEKFINDNNEKILISGIDKDISSIIESSLLLKINFDDDTRDFRQSYIITNIILILISILLLSTGHLITYIKGKIKEKTYIEIENNLDDIANVVLKWEIPLFENKIEDTSSNALERRVYSKILSSENNLESHKDQMNLYQKLYTMIGFEIRGLTNTINGGIQAITKESDEHGIFLGHEIMAATNTLNDLAENFNQLLSMGTNRDALTTDIQKLMSILLPALTSKLRKENRYLECITDTNIPIEINGNQVGLFWVLLLNISNSSTKKENIKSLLHVSSISAESIEHVTLRFEMIHTANIDISLAEIDKLDWKVTNSFNSNEKISNLLLSGMTNLDIIKFDCEFGNKLQVNIDVTPSIYPSNIKPLDGKKFLICGDSPFQVDIIVKTLSDYGATTHIATNPNHVFQSITKIDDLDVVFLTETIPGVSLASFCKTLRSRLSKAKKVPKLFLSVSDPEVADNTFEHVDHIFYRPTDNQSFMNKLTQQLEQEAQESDNGVQRVLIVEDDEIQQIILGQLLSDFNIESDVASSGEEAIEFLAENTPALIFMDCIMPGMGGIEATKKIRENEGDSKKTTIIGATALTGRKEKKNCIDAGMDYVISKPYKDSEILRLLKNYLAIQRVD